ncbi:hypothetical protein QUW44_05895 [Limosilactobacillus pontis]|uniref:HAD family hydrolase n=1 Tax=Limosilactobacillus pontis TaxID=35787 RepID=A0ABT7UYB8_9LACO|nr:hypothetical protein [Limosilactobacillus pontis]MDM8266691.1 hypothetical protein [Limosilactobacillus pontis]
MNNNLIGIFRFKILTSQGPYYFWKAIGGDLNQLEVVEQEREAAKMTAPTNRDLFRRCLLSPNIKVTCAPVRLVHADSVFEKAAVTATDMVKFSPNEVLPGTIPYLYAYSSNFGIDAAGKLVILEENAPDLKGLIKLMAQYPQIDFGMSYQKDELQRRIDRLADKGHALECAILKHWLKRLDGDTDLQRRLQELYDFQPFTLGRVKVDQDHQIPLFFKDYYPSHYLSFRSIMQQKRDRTPQHVKLYQNIDNQFMELSGLKYKFEEDQVEQGAQRENASHKQDLVDFLGLSAPVAPADLARATVRTYSKQLLALLNDHDNRPVIMAAIPSHKRTIRNIVSRVVDHLANATLFIKNGNEFIVKTQDEQAAHTLKGTAGRNSQKHEETMAATRQPTDYEKNLPLIIIDDMSTTGSSMVAATDHFRKLGFKHIYNFIFGRSIPYLSIQDFHPELKTFDGVVFDLDQTIYDSAHATGDAPARLYFPDLFQKLAESGLKVVFITQSSYKRVIKYCDDPFLIDHLYKEDQGNYVTTVHVGPNGEHYYKPSGVTIREAVKKYLGDCKNIVGIGNNETDILAYTNAGIDTALAEWGNPLKGVPTKANYRLKDEDDLLNLLQLN